MKRASSAAAARVLHPSSTRRTAWRDIQCPCHLGRVAAPRNVSAADCRAATQPSLRPCRRASPPAATRTPKFDSRAPLSATTVQVASRSWQAHPTGRSRRRRTASRRGRPDSRAVPAGERSTRSVTLAALKPPRRGSRRPRSPTFSAASRRRSRSSGHIRRHHAVHREQLGGVGAEPAPQPASLDEGRPEPNRIRIGFIARQPRRYAALSGRRPAGHSTLSRPLLSPPQPSGACRPRPPAAHAGPAWSAVWWAGSSAELRRREPAPFYSPRAALRRVPPSRPWLIRRPGGGCLSPLRALAPIVIAARSRSRRDSVERSVD